MLSFRLLRPATGGVVINPAKFMPTLLHTGTGHVKKQSLPRRFGGECQRGRSRPTRLFYYNTVFAGWRKCLLMPCFFLSFPRRPNGPAPVFPQRFYGMPTTERFVPSLVRPQRAGGKRKRVNNNRQEGPPAPILGSMIVRRPWLPSYLALLRLPKLGAGGRSSPRPKQRTSRENQRKRRRS